jgi:hypothetical protein
MGGHLFIVHGDLTLVGCDAWLLPCDRRARPEPSWLRSFEVHPPFPKPSEAWRSGAVRSAKVEGWPASLPAPWITNVGAGRGAGIEWFVRGAEEFVERAAEDVRGRAPRHGRAKPILALPVVGTGRGGMRGETGDVVRELVPLLQRMAREKDLDLALVSNDHATFTAAEAQRGSARDAFPDLDDRLWRESERLARIATQGELVLFIGAGVSKNAGLPDWDELLRDLAREAGMNEAELEALRGLGALDQARAAEIRLEMHGRTPPGVRPLARHVSNAFEAVHGYALGHALLAALPVREVVTTNYDTLFERASLAIGKTVSVLPHSPRTGASRWVLKMHGCVTDPENIVLTREDYMRYDLRRQALAGIVQALLLMRHMLFIGFSLRDDNFHRIADAVRRARVPQRATTGEGAKANPSTTDHFGTAIALFSAPIEQSLWGTDLDWVTMDETNPSAQGDQDKRKRLAGAARTLEIFLDAVLAKTGTTTYLLDPRYEGALSAAERRLSEKLRHFLEEIAQDPAAEEAPAWQQLEALLEQLGWRGKTRRR